MRLCRLEPGRSTGCVIVFGLGMDLAIALPPRFFAMVLAPFRADFRCRWVIFFLITAR